MNRTTRETARPNSAAERDCAGVIPIVAAEKTMIASLIPKLAGVTASKIPSEVIEVKNKDFVKLISIPKTLNWRKRTYTEPKIILKDSRYPNELKLPIAKPANSSRMIAKIHPS